MVDRVVVERETVVVVKLVKSCSPPLSAIILGVSCLACGFVVCDD